ncbi:S-adenosylmethionine decarboxylase [Halosquirtibacter laminarini]|uniref:S-adenosylmethionine decarboxylase n=1 Tax=Halosquirtibacter laminarini TaxID=3374600 RepID=A0AC61NGY0_9BACT|nr:S-adenosylmethionine decarboxylase [Prolixibacteraceae bacterium]
MIQHKTIEANIYKYSGWIKDIHPIELKEIFTTLLDESTFTILSFSEYAFPVEGYSAIWLLGESHLALHSFPNKETCYIELSSCNKNKMDSFIIAVVKEERIHVIKDEKQNSSLEGQ